MCILTGFRQLHIERCKLPRLFGDCNAVVVIPSPLSILSVVLLLSQADDDCSATDVRVSDPAHDSADSTFSSTPLLFATISSLASVWSTSMASASASSLSPLVAVFSVLLPSCSLGSVMPSHCCWELCPSKSGDDGNFPIIILLLSTCSFAFAKSSRSSATRSHGSNSFRILVGGNCCWWWWWCGPCFRRYCGCIG